MNMHLWLALVRCGPPVGIDFVDKERFVANETLYREARTIAASFSAPEADQREAVARVIFRRVHRGCPVFREGAEITDQLDGSDDEANRRARRYIARSIRSALTDLWRERHVVRATDEGEDRGAPTPYTGIGLREADSFWFDPRKVDREMRTVVESFAPPPRDPRRQAYLHTVDALYRVRDGETTTRAITTELAARYPESMPFQRRMRKAQDLFHQRARRVLAPAFLWLNRASAEGRFDDRWIELAELALRSLRRCGGSAMSANAADQRRPGDAPSGARGVR